MGLALKTSAIAQAKTRRTFQDHSFKYKELIRQKIQYTKKNKTLNRENKCRQWTWEVPLWLSEYVSESNKGALVIM